MSLPRSPPRTEKITLQGGWHNALPIAEFETWLLHTPHPRTSRAAEPAGVTDRSRGPRSQSARPHTLGTGLGRGPMPLPSVCR